MHWAKICPSAAKATRSFLEDILYETATDDVTRGTFCVYRGHWTSAVCMNSPAYMHGMVVCGAEICGKTSGVSCTLKYLTDEGDMMISITVKALRKPTSSWDFPESLTGHCSNLQEALLHRLGILSLTMSWKKFSVRIWTRNASASKSDWLYSW